MKRKRVHILSAVNAANVSKAGSTYTVRDVCGAVDGIVMNGMLYPGEQLEAAAATLDGKPAPAGHPKDSKGRAISALTGEALLKSYAGAVCRNARHEGGRTLVDIEINEAQARAHPDGVRLLERLDAAIAATNAEPIHVSTGLFCSPITANGESMGKPYSQIATSIKYDHLAFLLHEEGAGKPQDGVGMFLNDDGSEMQIETVELPKSPADRRSEGLVGWLRKLIGNSDELSFEQISDGLYKALPEGAWLREVFPRYAVWTDRDGRMFRQDYAVSSEGSVAWSGTAVEVRREVSYEPISNCQEHDPVKDKILAALNQAGIKTEGLDDAALLAAYNALAVKPVQDRLDAANSKLAEQEAAARAATEQEVATLAAELAVNSALSVDDFKRLGVERLRELKGKATAAPVKPGAAAANEPEDEFKGYSLNAFIKPAGQAA